MLLRLDAQDRLLTEVAQQHRREMRIAAGGEDGEAVPRCPQDDARDPLLEPKPDRGGNRAVDDRQPARRAAQEDRDPKRAVDRHLEPGDVFGLSIAFAASSFFLSFFSFGGGALIA